MTFAECLVLCLGSLWISFSVFSFSQTKQELGKSYHLPLHTKAGHREAKWLAWGHTARKEEVVWIDARAGWLHGSSFESGQARNTVCSACWCCVVLSNCIVFFFVSHAPGRWQSEKTDFWRESNHHFIPNLTQHPLARFLWAIPASEMPALRDPEQQTMRNVGVRCAGSENGQASFIFKSLWMGRRDSSVGKLLNGQAWRSEFKP